MQALRLRASDFGERVWIFKDASGLLARLAIPGQGGIEAKERHAGARSGEAMTRGEWGGGASVQHRRPQPRVVRGGVDAGHSLTWFSPVGARGRRCLRHQSGVLGWPLDNMCTVLIIFMDPIAYVIVSAFY